MSAAAASAPEWNDLQIIQALQGVEKDRWWNIASSALGTCSLARRALAHMVYVKTATAAAVAATIGVVAVAARRRDRCR